MKFYPYSKIQSNNLKILLYVARALAIIGFISLIVALVSFALSPFFGSESVVMDMGDGIRTSVHRNGQMAFMMITGVWSFLSALFTLAFSGLCAAAVSAEYQYTKAK